MTYKQKTLADIEREGCEDATWDEVNNPYINRSDEWYQYEAGVKRGIAAR